MTSIVVVDPSSPMNSIVLVEQIQGPAGSGSGGGGGPTTGIGFGYWNTGVVNSAAIALTGDVSMGALASPNVPLTVTGLQGKALPALSAGLLQYSGSAWSLAALTSAQLPAITLTGQVTGSASGGSIATTLTSANLPAITLTSDCTGGPTTGGSIATTVVSLQTATIAVANNSGTMQWWNGGTPLLDQATTSAATGANFTIAPQVSTNASGTPGSAIVSLGAPVGAGAYASFQVQQVGSSPLQVAQLGMGSGVTAGCNCLWLPAGSSPSGSNPTLFTFAAKTYVNATVAIEMAISGSAVHRFDTNGASLNSNATSATGVGIVLLGPASANPSSITSPAFTLYYDNTTNNGLLAIGPSSAGLMLESIVPLWAGTQNSQAGLIRKFGQFLRTTNATSTTAITIPLPTSSTSCMVIVHGVGRNVTALASSAQMIAANVLNTAGTLTITQTTLFTAGATTVSVTTSTTNILVQVTGTAADNVDWTVKAVAIFS